ncbi:N-acetyltransferase [Lentzea sp. NBRC 105346]|uniref:GNAT family N-acetyltransferase n=1 Tax=Lentzea sp. NBRC 105346 TaxID=3032205 RepID=UPI0024A4FAB9|nr:GNAT family N-acetyltransferase [Lentzea sp. NBRC 105346]GLZ29970.1 N-acetyltransferase [Lentzea sp. NBRC 105346]
MLHVRPARTTDPEAAPLIEALTEDYAARYGEPGRSEMTAHPPEEFAPPHGAFLLLFDRTELIAGGAFRRFDATTAELKRIWTHAHHRRRGLARRVLTELEREAKELGYRRLYLTTGPRQPEARGLYLASGYTPLFDVSADPLTIGPLPFEKRIA